MDGGRHLAGSAGHAPVGHQRHLETAILQHTERRCQAVQLRHAIGLRPLEADDGDEVAVELAVLERVLKLLLVVEHDCRCFDNMALRLDGGNLDDRFAEITGQHLQTTSWLERGLDAGKHLRVVALLGGGLADNRALLVKHGIHGISLEALSEDGAHIVMHEALFQKLLDEEAHAAGGVEMVHIGKAVGINAGEQRHDVGEIGNILPGEDDAGGASHGDQMHCVVGGATRRMQADDAVDDGSFIDHLACRGELVALRGNRQRTLGSFTRQRIAQRRAGIDEGGAGHVETHDLHQHLVGIGGAVEGAGAGAVIGFRFRFQKLGAADLAFGIKLAHARLLVIGQAGCHRAGGNEDGGQMAEGEGCDDEAGHDLVTNTEIDGGVEHVVRQADAGRHGDGVAGKQRKLHARLALRHAVAHGGNRACHLRYAASFLGCIADDRRKGLIGLVRREHVVIGGDDAEVWNPVAGKDVLVGGGTDGKSMRKIAAGKHGTVNALRDLQPQPLEIGLAVGLGTFDDAGGDGLNAGIGGHGRSSCSLVGNRRSGR